MAGGYTNQGKSAMAATAFVCCLATFSTVVRFFNRHQNRRRPQKDDWCMLLGLICSFSMTILVFIQVSWAYRLNAPAANAQKFQDFLLINYIVEIFYTTSHALIKLAIVFFFLDVFGTKTWIRRTCYGVMAFMAAWWIAFELGGIFQCSPVSGAWVLAVRNRPDTKCIRLPVFFIAQRATNLLTDLVLLAIPVIAVSKLQASMAKKCSLIFAFSLGGVACFACAYTLGLTVPMMGRLISFNDSRSFIWTVVELELGIVCANLPFCYPYVVRAVPKPFKMRVANTVAKLDRTHGDSSQRRRKQYTGSRGGSFGGRDDTVVMHTIGRQSMGSEEEILDRDNRKIYVTQEFTVEDDVSQGGRDSRPDSTNIHMRSSSVHEAKYSASA
ncbi:hypothetical protein KC332_g8097 [Hortaea werneckii]|uniref:Rhodopsin domain-containing protein n=2 Tax=Hortaea werneckii TaxID=91943 RepID=A0A3M7IMN3_HORWE|nr:hypothetical protein KC358_g5628 [Hortaea werneckii]OTA39128.1 hypothetical protein BTJ68_00933 [Hortaea werneckii EXF-2000]KAI6936410.1 hypothetical protein KC348_g6027 [Hortaea werneckii]KAI7039307.1 hypothetical protein KC366_g6207 [Hortaea werneckii]KAI7130844.1 hypothetical protein KC337_g6598 [Hortaea werneckii]